MSVSIFLARALLETVEPSGASITDLLARAALDSRRLDEAEARLELDEFQRLLASAIALTGDEAIGLHMAERISDMTLGPLAHLIAHAPTLREAIAIDSQFAGLAMDGLRLAAGDEGDSFVIRCAFPRATPVWDRTLAEFTMAGLVRLARRFAGAHASPERASFEHERPNHRHEYTSLFGNNVRFRQSETAIAFDRELVDRRPPRQDPTLYSLLRAEAERQLDRLANGASYTDRLHQYLLAVPPSRIPSVATAARDLGMSERSLQRRLVAEGTSYREVVRLALETSSGRLLRDPAQSIKEIAVALGFADTAAFVRAFKRWTGTTPKEYRRARHGG
jgi:AraC-like DNA-binding protein